MVFALPGTPSISVLPFDNLSKSIERSLAGATALLQKAIALDDSTAEAYGLLGFVFSHKRQHERALSQAEKAIELSPSSSASHFRLAKILNFSDRNNEAILEYKIVIRLNPIPPSIYYWSLGLAYAETGQYEEGIAWCEKAIDREPDSLLARIMLTAVYGWQDGMRKLGLKPLKCLGSIQTFHSKDLL